MEHHVPQVTQRFLVVLLIFCFGVGFYAFFASDYFSPQIRASSNIKQMAVQVLPRSNNAIEKQSMPHSWATPDSGVLGQVHYRVSLPSSELTAGQAIYIAGFRQAIEVWAGDILLAEGGNEKTLWMRPVLHTLLVPLNRVPQARVANGVHLDIVVRAAGVASGGLGPVYMGDATELAAARALPIRLSKSLAYAGIGVLGALLLLLAIDALYSGRSQQRFLLTVPHFFLAIQFLPELSFDPQLMWYKIYKLTCIACVVGWANFGLSIVVLPHRWFRPMTALMAALAVPYVFFDDIKTVDLWVNWVHDPVVAICCTFAYCYVVFNWWRSTDRAAMITCLTAGTMLMGAGLYEQYLIRSGDVNLQLHGLPYASLVIAITIFIWTAGEMLGRGKKLEQHRLEVLSLVASRTRELDEAKITLIQQQRYLNLNSMGAAISHEIKNPLGSLFNDFQLLSRLLNRNAESTDLPLARMKRSMERIDDIITKLASYSRKSVLSKSTHDYSEWLKALLADSETQLLLCGAELKVHIDTGPVISFDPELMRRSCLNVIENSIRAVASQETKKIEVRAWQEEKMVHTLIADNGRGFELDELEHLLEPLVSGTGSMGLGLAIVRDTVVMHHGAVELRNRADGGAEVLISLPVTII